jgi:hypothetical protein
VRACACVCVCDCHCGGRTDGRAGACACVRVRVHARARVCVQECARARSAIMRDWLASTGVWARGIQGRRVLHERAIELLECLLIACSYSCTCVCARARASA